MKKIIALMSLLFCFAAYGQRFIQSVTNVAALVNQNVLSIQSGVMVLGYSTAGDGGGGMFWATNTVVGTNLNDLIASVSNPGWSWKRLDQTITMPGLTNFIAGGYTLFANGFTTNADPPVTIINTATNPVPVVGTNSDSSVTVSIGGLGYGTSLNPLVVSTGTNILLVAESGTNIVIYTVSPAAASILTNVLSNLGTNGMGGDASNPVWTTNSNAGTITGAIAVTNLVGVVGTNQVSFSVNATNLCNNVTNAGVSGYCAWSVTNEAFTATGGSGLLQSMCLLSATNRDLTLWVFSKVITAPTSGSAWQPTMADSRFLVGSWDTTNSMWRAWQQMGTNWVKHLDRLSTPVLNTDASKNLHIIATYLDTKSNYTANSSMIMTGFINEK